MPTDDEFDAIAAARELDEFLADTRSDTEKVEAEIEAAKKRLEAASKKELEQRTRKILEGFLPVLDDLDRAAAAAAKHIESRDVVEGLELVRRSLLARLGQFGVAHAPALGQRFDPLRHEAIALVPVTDPAQDGYVIDVMREGYRIGDDTLRPAGVAVGRLSR